MIKAYLTGLFPRSKSLRKALREFEKKNIDYKELMKVYQEETRKLVELQINSNLDFVYDGMLAWQDLLRPICNYKGITQGPLIRWFETNFFYRVPIINDKIEFERPIIRDYYFLNLINDSHKTSVCIIDPLSIVYLSENIYYKKYDELLFDLTSCILKDLNYISENIGALHLISPVLGTQNVNKDELHILNHFLDNLRKRFATSIITLNIYYMRNLEIIPLLNELNIDIIGIDLCYWDREKILNKIKDLNLKIALGLVDSFVSYIENIEYIKKQIHRILHVLKNKDEVYVINSSDLDRLPYDVAMDKVNLFSKIKTINP